MNLAIDIGNTSAKMVVYDQNNKVYASQAESLSIDILNKLFGQFPVKQIIVSSVREQKSDIENVLIKTGIKFHIFNHKSTLPFTINYKSPQTLGSDRLAGIAGAHNMYPGENVLVIDAGTAITYDILNSHGVYLGGNISPGLIMRFRSLNSFTGKLPLLSASNEINNPGQNTEEAIRTGVQLGLIFEINEYIRNFKINYKDLRVIMTGGDGFYFSKNIDSSCKLAPDLIVDGLNYILENYV